MNFASGTTPTAEITVGTPPPSAVPEPSTYALFSLGIAGLALWKRRQKKA